MKPLYILIGAAALGAAIAGTLKGLPVFSTINGAVNKANPA